MNLQSEGAKLWGARRHVFVCVNIRRRRMQLMQTVNMHAANNHFISSKQSVYVIKMWRSIFVANMEVNFCRTEYVYCVWANKICLEIRLYDGRASG